MAGAGWEQVRDDPLPEFSLLESVSLTSPSQLCSQGFGIRHDLLASFTFLLYQYEELREDWLIFLP